MIESSEITERGGAIVVTVPITEWSKLHQRVGFPEGAMKGLRFTEDLEKSLDQIDARYREMMS